jgi:hypothetical protein
MARLLAFRERVLDKTEAISWWQELSRIALCYHEFKGMAKRDPSPLLK